MSSRVSTTTDLWSVDQTKAAFLGITAHWIETDEKTDDWKTCSQVVAFTGISGAHTGKNLGRYFVGLCERVGIIQGSSSKVCTLSSDQSQYNHIPSAVLCDC